MNPPPTHTPEKILDTGLSYSVMFSSPSSFIMIAIVLIGSPVWGSIIIIIMDRCKFKMAMLTPYLLLFNV